MRNGVVPEHWTDFYEATHIPAAAADGDRLYVTGHTGEDPDGNFSADPETQIRQTFRHINATLSKGGASWADVVELNSYHVGLQAQAEGLIAIAGEFSMTPIRLGQPSGSPSCSMRELSSRSAVSAPV